MNSLSLTLMAAGVRPVFNHLENLESVSLLSSESFLGARHRIACVTLASTLQIKKKGNDHFYALNASRRTRIRLE